MIQKCRICGKKALVSCIDCTKIPEGKFCNCYHSRIQNCLACNQITGNCSNCLQGYFPAKNGEKCIRNGTCLVTQDCGLNQFCQGSKCVKGDLAHPVSCGELLNCTSCVSPFFCLRCSGDYHLGEDLKCLTPRCETLGLNQYCKDVNVPAACPGPFACRCPNQRDHCATCDSDGCATCLAGFALSKHGCTRNVCTSSADCLFGSFCAEKGCQGCESIGSGGYCNCGALVQNCALCGDGVCLKCQHGSQLTQGYCVITDSSDGAVDVKLMIEISVAIIIVVIGVTLIILFVIFKKYSPKQNGFEKMESKLSVSDNMMCNQYKRTLDLSLSSKEDNYSSLVIQCQVGCLQVLFIQWRKLYFIKTINYYNYQQSLLKSIDCNWIQSNQIQLYRIQLKYHKIMNYNDYRFQSLQHKSQLRGRNFHKKQKYFKIS
ncbi:Cysteine-rich membrane protein 2 [Spironucleus salmonicida]|uniref:Cysteine-rich membrane protein 2 n=1 Tax=Spironucleus salmonicida TaxID=348837 RepID=A0A9P8LX34_9EUKA|nr:Cysteine-rich membrane protein 2 [Spironucleus salmonicida]